MICEHCRQKVRDLFESLGRPEAADEIFAISEAADVLRRRALSVRKGAEAGKLEHFCGQRGASEDQVLEVARHSLDLANQLDEIIQALPIKCDGLCMEEM